MIPAVPLRLARGREAACVLRRRYPLARTAVWVFLAPGLGLAQTPDAATNQRILEELKGVRASLERLKQSHKALIALTRLQWDESQVAPLQEKRQWLSAQELEAPDKIAAANRAETANASSSAPPGAAPDPAAQVEASLARSFSEQATRTLKELTRSREALDQEIARIKGRITEVEKFIDASLASGNPEPPKR